jgi:hypothetical protein
MPILSLRHLTAYLRPSAVMRFSAWKSPRSETSGTVTVPVATFFEKGPLHACVRASGVVARQTP